MLVKFEFNTADENFDNIELEEHLQAHRMAYCLSRITDQLRGWYKYDTRGEIPIDEVHEKLWDIINEEVDMERLGY